MKQLLILFLSLGMIQPFAYAQQAGENNKEPQTYAVIVGIAGYKEKDIPQLRFANRDANEFAAFLGSKAGGSVPKENITLLVDSGATTGAVIDAIYQLSKTAAAGDLVYFYFSGHGDQENTIHKNGYLICYDSPPVNYAKLALSIDYLNDMANTLSAQTKAKVVLITDACHSGKLAGSKNKGTFLVGNQLRLVRNNEIRITSSAENQLSNENEAWGGGRGVFSYYLINGLKGLADRQKDGIITKDEIRVYLDSALANDPVLKREDRVQTPVIKGSNSFPLAKVDTAVSREAEKEMKLGIAMMQASAPVASNEEMIPFDVQQYFFSLLKKINLEEIINADYTKEELNSNGTNQGEKIVLLSDLDPAELPYWIILGVMGKIKSPAGLAKLRELDSLLRINPAMLKKFNRKLAIALDERGQVVINQYLKGDEAELEKRRYYNSYNHGYEVYPQMFKIAWKLTPQDSYFSKILEMKMHYFRGVSIRLSIPTVKEPMPLIEEALEEQKKALALAEDAAYIYNELGVLYQMKKEYGIAEDYYKKASAISPEWVVPWANLSGLYASTRNFEKGFEAAGKAMAISPELLCLYVNSGFLQEKKGNLLKAEESYRHGIKINSRHFSPFERLGYVYLNTTQYALADSFLYEGEARKKGFRFPGDEFEPDKQGLTPSFRHPLPFCNVDSNDVKSKDVLGLFSIGFLSCESFDSLNADGVIPNERGKGFPWPYDKERAERSFRKILSLDKTNPLAGHYLGKLLYGQNKCAEAELMLKHSLTFRPDSATFMHYLDSMALLLPKTASQECIIKNSKVAYFNFTALDNHYYLASLYEKWNHFDEAEKRYRIIISIDPTYIGGYYKLWYMLESIGKYREAENLIFTFMAANPAQKNYGENELNAFYERVLKVFPLDPEWNYRAGLFLYRVAADRPGDFPFDRKTILPDRNLEIFLRNIGNAPMMNYYPMLPGPGIDWIVDGASKRPQQFEAYSIVTPFTDAIRYLEKADSLSNFTDEDLAGINDKLGDLYTWQGLQEKAIGRYERSLMLQPENSGVRMKLIDGYDFTFRLSDALSQLDSLDKRQEINYSKLLLKVKYQMQAGDFAEAEKLLTRAEKTNPLSDPVLIDLNGRLMMLSGKASKAIPYYQKLLELDPFNSDLQYTLAKLYARIGKQPEAWKWLTESLKNGFSYAFVITSDNDWEKYREQPRWRILTRSMFKKEYPLEVSPFKRLFEGY